MLHVIITSDIPYVCKKNIKKYSFLVVLGEKQLKNIDSDVIFSLHALKVFENYFNSI